MDNNILSKVDFSFLNPDDYKYIRNKNKIWRKNRSSKCFEATLNHNFCDKKFEFL